MAVRDKGRHARPPPRRRHRLPTLREDLTPMAADARCARGAD